MPFINIDQTKQQDVSANVNANGIGNVQSPYPSLNEVDDVEENKDLKNDEIQKDEIKKNDEIVSKDPVSADSPLFTEAVTAKPELNHIKETVGPDGIRILSRPMEVEDTEIKTNTEVTNAEMKTSADEVAPAMAINNNDSKTVEDVEVGKVKTVETVEKIEDEKVETVETVEDVKDVKMVEPVVPEKIPDNINQAQEVSQEVTKELSHTDKFEKLQASQSIEEYAKMAIDKDASDLHFTATYPVYFRVDGTLQRYGVDGMKNEQIEKILSPILNEKQKKDIDNNIEVDMVYQHPSGNRFRVNVFRQQSNLAAAFRLIPKRVRTIDELGLPVLLKEFSKIPYGLVVVTGPTGSGKSTTIAAMIEEINRTDTRHIITIEDPVEYVFEQKMALIAQRNMYEDSTSWTKALRAVLRQDPNVVVIGEMRDYETIASALTIAETGHLVFATLHTNNAAQTIDRIIDVFPEGQQNQVRSQLSNMLSGVIAQRLIPVKNGGRKAAVEILIGTIAIKNAIREGKTHQIDNIIQTSADIGMISLEKSLIELIRQGLVDIDTAKNFSAKPDELDLLMR